MPTSSARIRRQPACRCRRSGPRRISSTTERQCCWKDMRQLAAGSLSAATGTTECSNGGVAHSYPGSTSTLLLSRSDRHALARRAQACFPGSGFFHDLSLLAARQLLSQLFRIKLHTILRSKHLMVTRQYLTLHDHQQYFGSFGLVKRSFIWELRLHSRLELTRCNGRPVLHPLRFSLRWAASPTGTAGDGVQIASGTSPSILAIHYRLSIHVHSPLSRAPAAQTAKHGWTRSMALTELTM